MDKYNRTIKGRLSKSRGQAFEGIIEVSCRYYRGKGVADILKSSEPMRPLSKPNSKGQFLACFTKKSGPDYVGVLNGGRFIALEAKHTDADRLQHSVVSEEQEKQLNRHTALGAKCFVIVSFRFQQFFKIPWEVFRDMKARYGRKYIRPKDVQEYKVRYVGGILQFL